VNVRTPRGTEKSGIGSPVNRRAFRSNGTATYFPVAKSHDEVPRGRIGGDATCHEDRMWSAVRAHDGNPESQRIIAIEGKDREHDPASAR
jgi:hypothetical protein